MEEAIETPISTEKTEQIGEEGGENQSTEGEIITDVINMPEEEPAEEPAEEEPEEVPSVASLEEEPAEEPAVRDAGKTVSVSIGGSSADLTQGTPATTYTATGTGAVVTITSGLAGTSGSILTDASDLTFSVAADTGYQLDTVKYTVGSGADQTVTLNEAKTATSADTTITAGDITDAVAIAVTVKKLYTVTFNVATGAQVTVNAQDITGTDTAQVADGENITFTTAVTDAAEYASVIVSTDAAGEQVVDATSDNTYELAVNSDITYYVTPVSKWSNATIAAPTVTGAAVTFTNTENASNGGRIEAGKDIEITVAVNDPMKEIDEDTFQVTDGEGQKVATTHGIGTNTWTIAADTIKDMTAGTTLTVTVTLKDKAADGAAVTFEIVLDGADVTLTGNVAEYLTCTNIVGNAVSGYQVQNKAGSDVTVSAAEGYRFAETDPVTAKIGDTDATVTNTQAKYTIADSAAATEAITITARLETIKYIVKAPAEDDARGITWQIKKQDDDNTKYADQVELINTPFTKENAVELKATLAAGKDSVGVSVKGGEVKTLTAGSSVTFEITLGDADYDAEDGVQLMAAYKDIFDVTIAGKNAGDLTGLGMKYAVKKNGKYDDADFADVTGNKVAAFEGETIGFKFTAPAKKMVKGVTYGTGSNPLSQTPEGIWEHEVSSTNSDNALTVEVDSVKTITVKAAAGAQIESVSYNLDSAGDKAVEASGADWKIDVPASATSVTVSVKAKQYNKVTYIHKGTDAHKDTGCTSDAFTGPADITAGTGALTIADIDAENGLVLLVGTLKNTKAYELVDNGVDKTKIVKDDGATEVKAETAETENKGKYVLDDGSTYYVSVSENGLERVTGVTADGQPLTHYPEKGFRFTATTESQDPDAGKIIITARTETQQTINVAYANAAGDTPSGDDFTATIQADEYATDAADGKASAADKEAKDIVTGTTKYTNVWENTPFTFTVKPKDTTGYYKITKVAAGDTAETAVTLTAGENDKYTIAKAKDTTIFVTVALNEDKAESIQFNDVNGNVQTLTVDLAGGADPADTASVKLGVKKFFKKNATTKKVTFKVAPMASYTVKEVKAGETVLEAAGGVYTVDFAEATSAVVDITTEASAVTADKYVTFNVDPESGVELKVDGSVKPIEKDGKPTTTYKLTKAQEASGNTAAVPEIAELKFDVIVPHGSYLTSAAKAGITISGVRATADKRTLQDDQWVYSYKVVTNEITGTELVPAEINIGAGAAALEKVTIKTAKAGQTAAYKKLDDGTSGTVSFAGVKAEPGDSILVTLKAGETATVNGEEYELDKFNTFVFEAELDDEKENDSEMVIDVAGSLDYTLKYAVETKPGNDNDYEEIEEDKVGAAVGDKVYVKLFDKAGTTAEAISKYAVKKESGEAATTVTLPAQEVDAETKGEAVIEVKDEAVTVDFYTQVQDTSVSYNKVKDVLAGSITIEATDATQVNLTAKGITPGRTITLDAASKTTYPLTIKRNNKAENAAAYDTLLKVTYGENKETTSTNVRALIDDGVLYIDTLKGGDVETEVKITAKGQAADAAPLLTFKVKGKTPALKVKSVDSPNQGVNEILVNATADGGIKPVSALFNYYYEINVAAKEGVTNKGTDKLGYYYVAAQADEKGKLQPLSQLVKVNTASTDAQTPNSYTISVKLVAKYDGVLSAVGTPLDGGAVSTPATVDFASADAAKKDIDTRAMRFENKLGVTRKTTKFYSGQSNVVVAVPKFSKDAGFVHDINAVVYNKDGSLATGVRANAVDPDTMEVSVDADAAGTYDVVIYATAAWNDALNNNAGDYDMYRASAKVPITVQKGINEIEVDPVDEVFIKDYGTTKARDVSFTLKPVGYYGGYDNKGNKIKAQTQKFEYKVNTFGNDKNEDKVVVKGNKITVKKDFYISNDPAKNCFDVDVHPMDYGENYGNIEYFTVTVTKNALELGGIKLKVGNKTYTDKSTISSHDLNGATVIVTDKAGKEISPRLVDFTPNKGGVYVNKNNEYETARVVVSKYAKTLTIKAVTRDGGKKNVSAKFNVGYISGANFVLTEGSRYGAAENPTISTGATLTKIGSRSWTFKGSNDDKINFTIKNRITDENGRVYYDQALKSYYNYTVKITGGKNTYSKSSEESGNYSILPNKDGKVVVSITDKSVQRATPVEFTITNTGWSKETAPSASTKDKLYYAKTPTGEMSSRVIAQDLTYTVKNNKQNYNAVQWRYVSGGGISGYLNGVYDIDAKGQFTVPDITTYGTGTEKYSLIYGKRNAEGVFTPMTKAATVSVKVNKVGNIKATAKYTISTNVGYRVKLEAKPSISFKDNQKLVDYLGVLSANIKGADKKFGQRNQFFDYFEVVDGKYLQIKEAKRTEAELAKLTKDDLTGYLEYRYVNDKGNVVTKQDKITVVIDEKGAPKYTATPINVVAAANVTAKTTITLGGEEVAIAAGKVKAAEGSGWTATCIGDDAAAGIVTLTAQTPANKNVDLYLIPAGSKYAAAGDPVMNGIKVTVAVKTVAANDTKSKVSLSKTAKVPTAEIVGGNSVELTATYELGKDFSLLWSNAEIVSVAKLTAEEEAALTKADEKTGAAAVKTVSAWDAEGKSFSIKFDREKLAKDGKTTYKVPVKLTFTSGAGQPEIIAFSVKPEKVPTMTEVETLIKDALVDKDLQGCMVSDPNNAGAAVSAVTAALAKVEIPALAGITAGGVAVKNADKFADNPSATPAVVGDHLIKITLTDVILATGAEGKTKDIEIKVVKAPDLTEEITTAVDKWRVLGDDGKVPEGKTAITLTSPTEYEVRDAIQAAVDKVYGANQYIVAVHDFRITHETVAAPSTGTSSIKVNADAAATIEKVTGMTFSYTVKNAATGTDLDEDTEEFTVTAGKGNTEGTIETPVVKPSQPVVEAPTAQSVAVTAAGNAEEITQNAVDALAFTATVTDSKGGNVTTVAGLANLKNTPVLTWKLEKKDAASGSEYAVVEQADWTTGGITFAADETDLKATLKVTDAIAENTMFKVTATVTGVNTPSSKEVTVKAADAVVNTVEVTPSAPSVAKGSTQQFTATLKDAQGGTIATTGKTISWEVTGGATGTTISTEGLLTV